MRAGREGVSEGGLGLIQATLGGGPRGTKRGVLEGAEFIGGGMAIRLGAREMRLGRHHASI
jgi:hypothetical protein